MKCKICNRVNLSGKELRIHMKYYHASRPGPPKICPECGATLWFQEGCGTCHNCGYSKCD